MITDPSKPVTQPSGSSFSPLSLGEHSLYRSSSSLPALKDPSLFLLVASSQSHLGDGAGTAERSCVDETQVLDTGPLLSYFYWLKLSPAI